MGYEPPRCQTSQTPAPGWWGPRCSLGGWWCRRSWGWTSAWRWTWSSRTARRRPPGSCAWSTRSSSSRWKAAPRDGIFKTFFVNYDKCAVLTVELLKGLHNAYWRPLLGISPCWNGFKRFPLPSLESELWKRYCARHFQQGEYPKRGLISCLSTVKFRGIPWARWQL